MAIQPILKYPHPLLKKVAHKVERLDTDIKKLLQDLLDTMKAGPGSVGVAAPQIGASLRVCVIDVSKSKHGKDNNHGLLCMLNPEILSAGEKRAVMREGCMSMPDYTGDVERATEITVRFLDGQTDEVRELDASGFEAVAIQHELDHLDGILFIDRVLNVSTGLFRRKIYI
jgi:peptide deformylase